MAASVTHIQGHDENRPDWLSLFYQLMSNNMIRAHQEVQQYFLFKVAFLSVRPSVHPYIQPSIHLSISPFPLMGVVITLIDRSHQLFTYPTFHLSERILVAVGHRGSDK